jgi:hypothetical protein
MVATPQAAGVDKPPNLCLGLLSGDADATTTPALPRDLPLGPPRITGSGMRLLMGSAPSGAVMEAGEIVKLCLGLLPAGGAGE